MIVAAVFFAAGIGIQFYFPFWGGFICGISVTIALLLWMGAKAAANLEQKYDALIKEKYSGKWQRD